jgi:hypothetical protein
LILFGTSGTIKSPLEQIDNKSLLIDRL